LRIPLAFAALVSGFSLAAISAHAQPPAGANGPVRRNGTVTSVSADSLTVKDKDGKETQLGLAKGWTLVTTKEVPQDAIKPGGFVATANLNQADGVGKSIEIRLFEPGAKLGEGSRPMAAPNTTMTNANVTKVAKTAAGLEIDVAYPGGSRHIIVPPDMKVIASIPTDTSALKAGAAVAALATRDPDGSLKVARVQMN
jgi:hypothetical protein